MKNYFDKITDKTNIVAFSMVFAFFFAISANAQFWSAPTTPPPGNNVPTPLNPGLTGQSKVGGLSVHTSSTDGVFYGLLVPFGKVGIGTENPASLLSVNGGVQVGFESACNAGLAGTMRWNSDSLEVCNGSAWVIASCSGTSCEASGLYTYDGSCHTCSQANRNLAFCRCGDNGNYFHGSATVGYTGAFPPNDGICENCREENYYDASPNNGADDTRCHTCTPTEASNSPAECACGDEGKYWYDNSCHDFPDTLECTEVVCAPDDFACQECQCNNQEGGGRWDFNSCHDPAQSECTATRCCEPGTDNCFPY